jgi:hypothetical protein
LDAQSYAGRITYHIKEWNSSKGPNLDFDDGEDDEN